MTRGATWDQPGRQGATRRIGLQIESEAHHARMTGAPVAIYIDLVPADAPGDAFADHIASRLGQFAGTMRVGLARRRPIPAEASSTTVTDLAQRIRTCAAQAATHRVHLFLRVPFPIAVQLGRALNTLEVTLYEWDDSCATPPVHPDRYRRFWSRRRTYPGSAVCQPRRKDRSPVTTPVSPSQTPSIPSKPCPRLIGGTPCDPFRAC